MLFILKRGKNMELTLKRIAKKDKYTIGKIYNGNTWICDTIEDKDRGLKSTMTEKEIAKIKVKNETAIPSGRYTITMDVVSPKYSKIAYYRNQCDGGKVPRLLNVKGFDGVLIHKGNTAQDSSGCIIVGRNTRVGMVLESQTYFEKIYKILKDAKLRGEKIYLTIQ